ncbi:hypothetical protein ABLE92_12130 [Gordonia sp. VNQ95]|uniref:hypothetical protein n=1 Tax=Gordonia sp. VNQ95 TaxID=3156619 RepID=UPI0032B36178
MPAQAWVTLIVGLVAAIGVIVTMTQKQRADNRREWWTRFEWALEATHSTNRDPRRDRWRVIANLAESRLMTATERSLVSELIGGITTEAVNADDLGVPSENSSEED